MERRDYFASAPKVKRVVFPFLFNVFPGGKFRFSTSSNRCMIYRIGGLIDVGKAGLFFSYPRKAREFGKICFEVFFGVWPRPRRDRGRLSFPSPLPPDIERSFRRFGEGEKPLSLFTLHPPPHPHPEGSIPRQSCEVPTGGGERELKKSAESISRDEKVTPGGKSSWGIFVLPLLLPVVDHLESFIRFFQICHSPPPFVILLRR